MLGEGSCVELEEDQVEKVCRSTKGSCRYLADFYSNCVCMRQADIEILVDQEKGKILGDFGHPDFERPINCSGPPDFTPTEDFI